MFFCHSGEQTSLSEASGVSDITKYYQHLQIALCTTDSNNYVNSTNTSNSVMVKLLSGLVMFY